MKHLLLSPLRLVVGWGISPRILGILAIAMLVLLRLTIGFHFFTEGRDKVRQGDWDAAPFFANAKGPYEEHFHQMVWDRHGEFRLNPENHEWWLGEYADRAADYYQFTDKEKKATDDALKTLLKNLELILESNADEIREYKLGLAQVEKLRQDPARQGVESLADQVQTVRRENDAKIKPVLAEIDQLWSAYEGTVNSLAAPNQRQQSPPIQITRPRLERVDTSLLNRVVPYFDLAIGWCLLLGLFTPVAALAAAGFLGSVFLSQLPPATGPSSTMYQLVECMACLVLAATGAGRFAGLDYFLHLIVRKSLAKDPVEKK
ncbi:DoxX family protein [Roseiconus lacunae]|uniref:DoxX family protein n=1 Tax=Roseiconus lacunae TaxID=2605694 RepID=A0ABT7PEY2_9BACT|nr:DoxX family protein [Roseiconus lacunae]MCD0460012.1 DoxX family protein [Roseiconus lacunae]MDM4014918.1 DoxX family protein [Roseiconus lacunae]WRQ50497.1 DoxX family protein [Stieleria sp. HD01]